MLHAAHLHWAPNADRVSISTWKKQEHWLSWLCRLQRVCWECQFPLTAVWAVMWVQPTTLAPARGFSPWARFLRAISAGISERWREQPGCFRNQSFQWMITSLGQFIQRNISCCIFGLIKTLEGNISSVNLRRSACGRLAIWKLNLWLTLLRNLDFSASEVGLFNVFDAKVTVAFGVLLLFVSGRRLIVRAVRVRRRWNRWTHSFYCNMKYQKESMNKNRVRQGNKRFHSRWCCIGRGILFVP